MLFQLLSFIVEFKERVAVNATGPTYNFFGCRGRGKPVTARQEKDEEEEQEEQIEEEDKKRLGRYSLYEEELEEMLAHGSLQLHELAFSRQEGQPKEYGKSSVTCRNLQLIADICFL